MTSGVNSDSGMGEMPTMGLIAMDALRGNNRTSSSANGIVGWDESCRCF